jgi:hypothetical protein
LAFSEASQPLKAELVVSHIPRALDEIVRGNRFQSVSEPWADNNTHADKMIVTIFAGTAGFECVLIRERTEASRVGARNAAFDSDGCQGRSKNRPVGQSRSGPVVSYEGVGLFGG